MHAISLVSQVAAERAKGAAEKEAKVAALKAEKAAAKEAGYKSV